MKRCLASLIYAALVATALAQTPLSRPVGPYSVADVTKFGALVPSSQGAGSANRTIIQKAIDYAVKNGLGIVQLPCIGGAIWVDNTIYLDAPDNHNVAVSGAAGNGSGLIRLTVTSTSGWSTGHHAAVWGVLGTTEANGHWRITVVDSTHIDLQGSTFTKTYTTSSGVAYNPLECFVEGLRTE